MIPVIPTDIVNIRYTENVKKKAKYFVNLGLKSGRGIKKAKEYYKGFKMTIAGVKYCYLFLAFLYLDSVKRVNNIKLSIKLGCIKLKKRVLKKGEKITVLNCDYIQRLVVNTKL
jgi:hypothetical protein